MSDLIDRQMAIDELTEIKNLINAAIDSLELDFRTEANESARLEQVIDDIETIKDLPSAQPEPCEDAVSRSEIIRLILERGLYCDTQADREISAEIIRQLPSVKPEIIRCGECKYWDTTWQNDRAPNRHYCPNVDGMRRNDFYCADAERRDDADHTEV